MNFGFRASVIACAVLVASLNGSAGVVESWKKARTVTGVVQDGVPCASVQIKCGKVSRTGVATVAMAVSPFFGRKTSYRSQKVTLPETGHVAVEWPDGARVELDDGRLVGGSLPDGRVLVDWTPATVQVNNAEFVLDADRCADALPGLFGDYLPSGLSVKTVNGRWTVADGAKAGKVVYMRGTQTVDESKLGANPAGLKLTYTAKTGLFKGTFKAWQDGNGKVRGVSAKVAGLLLADTGYGQVQMGKQDPIPMRIEGDIVPSSTPSPSPEPGASDGVQLWEGGPCWADRNVGASRPTDSGYYFWWGDTVGYAWSGGMWISSAREPMSFSPFEEGGLAVTWEREYEHLLQQGYFDANGNLAAEHDAATVHLGAPWRLPTAKEIGEMLVQCDWKWTKSNGVNGMRVTGRGAYSSRSIFLPAAGRGRRGNLVNPGLYGYYWSSTPNESNWGLAWYLEVGSDTFRWDDDERWHGRCVRPVR